MLHFSKKLYQSRIVSGDSKARSILGCVRKRRVKKDLHPVVSEQVVVGAISLSLLLVRTKSGFCSRKEKEVTRSLSTVNVVKRSQGKQADKCSKKDKKFEDAIEKLFVS